MSISSNPASFLARAKKIGVPEEAIASFLAAKPVGGLIHVYNGNSRYARTDVAQFYEAENQPGFDFPASIRLCREHGRFAIVRIKCVAEKEVLGYFYP